MSILYKIGIFLLITSFIFPVFTLAQETKPPIEAPESFEEAGSFVGKFISKIPETFKNAWESAKGIWQGTWVKWWDEHIGPWCHNAWQEICIFFGKEIEERKPIIEEEFDKEKQEIEKEIKEGASETSKNLWEWIKGLVKENL